MIMMNERCLSWRNIDNVGLFWFESLTTISFGLSCLWCGKLVRLWKKGQSPFDRFEKIVKVGWFERVKDFLKILIRIWTKVELVDTVKDFWRYCQSNMKEFQILIRFKYWWMQDREHGDIWGCNAMQCNSGAAMQCNATSGIMQCNATLGLQCNAMQCNAMQLWGCNAMQHLVSFKIRKRFKCW